MGIQESRGEAVLAAVAPLLVVVKIQVSKVGVVLAVVYVVLRNVEDSRFQRREMEGELYRYFFP